MATTGIPALARSANPRALNKPTAQTVNMARIHLRADKPRAYARALLGENRATNQRQQRAIEMVIASDGQERLFVRHPANGCLLAMEN